MVVAAGDLAAFTSPTSRIVAAGPQWGTGAFIQELPALAKVLSKPVTEGSPLYNSEYSP
jgi:hypothetical protein